MNKKRVLIIEDDKNWRDTISWDLSNGFVVETAPGYGEAIAKIKNTK